ncbi:HIT family protein [Gordonia desulfuricans]|uniref:HIT family protein n=1 Tax=Gordonia desulfuricans TaxID=89051 RepID=A0A7K3LMU1_9ACTN|nr:MULTISPECIES: HIT family protein [Gordonia]EMP12840.2 HIT family hydrolase [Gordonia sp. NB41Y]NDK89562.1 HIT family protein [Gordonia desulfuricans]WLP91354.1 HIT family protein [Gordonia sp. NB41Y]
MTDCVFCDIVSGTSPARIVYSDDHVVGFLDIRPIVRGHTLIVPRRHSAGLADLDPDAGARVLWAGQKVAAAMRSSELSADGINLAINDGRAAFQTVFHTHLHVVPRTDGDRVRFVRGLVVRRDPDPDTTARILRDALTAEDHS